MLQAARAAGLGVILKEVHANGRLTAANRLEEDAALVARLRSAGERSGLDADLLAELQEAVAEPPEVYWARRAALPWH